MLKLVYIRWRNSLGEGRGYPFSHEPAKWHKVLTEGLEAATLYPHLRNRIEYCWLSEHLNSLNLGIRISAFTDEELKAELSQLRQVFVGAIEIALFPNASVQIPNTAQVLSFNRGIQAA